MALNVFELFGKIAIDSSGAEKGLNSTVGHAKNAEGKLAATFKKIGTVVAAAFSVKAIVDFGKQCTQAYASIAAEESAFAQIMGDYADTAQAKLNAVADQTGITSTRMTGAMTSLTAKFKGLGYSTEDATTLATDGLLIAADAAAFWDMSLDESMSHLNSFINGSYEGGEAIGLFANDTQMAAYAIEQGIVADTKAWSQLDEATKQATRLAYAKSMMEQSGAVGQAAKESQAYANVMANLKESWRQFQGVVGKPILEKLVLPAMQGLLKMMPSLTEAVQVGIDYLSAGFDKVAYYFSDVFTEDGLNTEALSKGVTNVFRDLGKEIPRLLPKIGNALSGLGSVALSAGSSIFAGLYNAITGDTVSAEAIEQKLAGLFSSGSAAINELTSAAGNLLGEIYEGITGKEATAENIRDTLKGVFDAGSTALSSLVTGATGLMNNLATVIGDDTMGTGEKIAAIFTEAQTAMQGLLDGAGTFLSDIYEEITGDTEGAEKLRTFWHNLFKPEEQRRAEGTAEYETWSSQNDENAALVDGESGLIPAQYRPIVEALWDAKQQLIASENSDDPEYAGWAALLAATNISMAHATMAAIYEDQEGLSKDAAKVAASEAMARFFDAFEQLEYGTEDLPDTWFEEDPYRAALEGKFADLPAAFREVAEMVWDSEKENRENPSDTRDAINKALGMAAVEQILEEQGYEETEANNRAVEILQGLYASFEQLYGHEKDLPDSWFERKDVDVGDGTSGGAGNQNLLASLQALVTGMSTMKSDITAAIESGFGGMSITINASAGTVTLDGKTVGRQAAPYVDVTLGGKFGRFSV